MIKQLVLLIAALSTSAYGMDLVLPIRGTVDGDTIKTTLPLPCPLCNASVRIRGIDTPEKGYRAKCTAEAELAAKASAFTRFMIGTSQTMEVSDIAWDKYGGRMLGTVIINGHNVGDELLSRDLAKPYNGGKKTSWCK